MPLVIAANVLKIGRTSNRSCRIRALILVELVAWIIIVIACISTGVRPQEITDHEIALTGVSEEFVESVAEADRERQERRAARRRERERPGRWALMKPTMSMTTHRGGDGRPMIGSRNNHFFPSSGSGVAPGGGFPLPDLMYSARRLAYSSGVTTSSSASACA